MLIKKANLIPVTKNPVCGELVTISPWYAYYLSMKDLAKANPNHLTNLAFLKHLEILGDGSYQLTDAGKEKVDFYNTAELLDVPIYIVHEHDGYTIVVNIETGTMGYRPEKKLNMDNMFKINNYTLVPQIK